MSDIDWDEIRNMLDYFHTEKGDIERWGSWEDNKAAISERYPELIPAMERIVIAERTLDAVISKIVNDHD